MTRIKTSFKTLYCSIALAGMAFTADASAACTRESLQQLTDSYISAQTTGNAALLPMAARAYYGENDQPKSIAEGMLSGAIKPDFTRSFLDTTECATFTEFVAANNEHPYVIHTRMEVNDDNEVTVMESVITDEGDWVFGAAEHLAVTREEDWGVIPEDQRDMRGVLKAAAEAYINNWGDPYLPVPHGTPCSRLEGRISTAARNPDGQACTMGAFPQPIKTGNRRFVIDETIGAVSIFHNFSWLDAGLGPYHSGTPASQTFRVQGGMNRYIHEVTVCTTPGCSRGRPGGPPPAQ
jgi:hypothetical protein